MEILWAALLEVEAEKVPSIMIVIPVPVFEIVEAMVTVVDVPYLPPVSN